MDGKLDAARLEPLAKVGPELLVVRVRLPEPVGPKGAPELRVSVFARDAGLLAVGVEKEDALRRLVDCQLIEAGMAVKPSPSELAAFDGGFGPHAVEDELAGQARGLEGLARRDEGVAVVVVEDVVLREPGIAHVEVLKDPQQQPAVSQVELPALRDDPQER